MAPLIHVPQHCHWALEQLYVFQRCNKQQGTSCDPAKRNFSDAQLTREMHTQYVNLKGVFARAGWPERAEPMIHKALPASQQKLRIVDIGAGLGMYHVHIREHFSKHWGMQTNVTIIDRSLNSVNASKGMSHAGHHAKPSQFPFYSSLECATDIAMASGFDRQHWYTVAASEPCDTALLSLGIGSVDLVMSLYSWTWHYLDDDYARAAAKVLKKNTGRLILTPRYAENVRMRMLRAGFTNCNITQKMLVCCVGCLEFRQPSES